MKLLLIAVKSENSSHPTKTGTEKHKVFQGQTFIIIPIGIGQKIYLKQFVRDQETYESRA